MRSGVVDPDHPANAAVLRRLARRRPDAAPDLAPEEVADHLGLGTHPDLTSHLWHELTEGMPDAERCARVVYGKPVLVSPRSGVIFGWAGGTHTIALRLPHPERDWALAAGGARVLHYYPAYPEIGIPASTDGLAELGEEWVFIGERYQRRWCRVARAFADEA